MMALQGSAATGVAADADARPRTRIKDGRVVFGPWGFINAAQVEVSFVWDRRLSRRPMGVNWKRRNGRMPEARPESREYRQAGGEASNARGRDSVTSRLGMNLFDGRLAQPVVAIGAIRRHGV